MTVAEGVEGLEKDDQGLLLDVDDALAAGHPAVGRGADVDQQQHCEVPAGRALRRVEPVLPGLSRAPVGEGGDVGREVEVRSVRLAAQTLAPGPEGPSKRRRTCRTSLAWRARTPSTQCPAPAGAVTGHTTAP